MGCFAQNRRPHQRVRLKRRNRDERDMRFARSSRDRPIHRRSSAFIGGSKSLSRSDSESRPADDRSRWTWGASLDFAFCRRLAWSTTPRLILIRTGVRPCPPRPTSPPPVQVPARAQAQQRAPLVQCQQGPLHRRRAGADAALHRRLRYPLARISKKLRRRSAALWRLHRVTKSYLESRYLFGLF